MSFLGVRGRVDHDLMWSSLFREEIAGNGHRLKATYGSISVTLIYVCNIYHVKFVRHSLLLYPDPLYYKVKRFCFRSETI